MRRSKLMVAGMLAAFAFSGPAFAAGSDSSGSDAPPEKTKTTTECKKGEVWDKKLKKCVEVKKSGMNADEIYDTARELAYFGRADEALALLAQMPDQGEPRVQNYLGFANRKLGNMDVAMVHYRKAIATNPDYVLARSYMGQGLLKMGNVGAARIELAQIRMRAGADNRPYRMLSDALAGKPVGY
jgi:Flp pilus assembly protein TadD